MSGAVDKPAKLSDGPGTLVSTARKARYGIAYLRAMCSQAGMPMSESSLDEDVLATDCLVQFQEAPVFVQVKCTSVPVLGAGNDVLVRLKPEWCQKWAKCRLPVYLVVVVVGGSSEEWLTHRPTATLYASAA